MSLSAKLFLIFSPGTYEHDVKRFRRVEFAGSFGGKQQLKETISIKCVQNNEDVVS